MRQNETLNNMNNLRSGFCDVDVVLKWLCLVVFGAIVMMAIVNICSDAISGNGHNAAQKIRDDQRIRRQQRCEKERSRCDVCHEMSRTTSFCGVCGIVCGDCLPLCYQEHPLCIQ